jgi:hypothetical protein
MDNFAKDHPLAAKVGSVILEGAGYLTVGATLCAAAEGGILPLLVSGSSMAVSNEVVAAALEHGSEYVVKEAAALGTTEAEAVQFGTAANGLINKFVLLGVVKATAKVVKGGKGTAKSLSASEAGAVSKEIFHQKQTAPAELRASISRGITEAVETNPLMKAKVELLAAPKMHKHHVFPQKFKPFFEKLGISIDDYCMNLGEITHGRGIHGSGNLGMMPGKWNMKWSEFIEKNPNATQVETYQFGGQLLDEFGLGHLPIIKYK